mmetsp:Transcript_35422/g.75432  ORF Transcript_35422/g.75432 Transcript_35422/m.75432 type:complete len:249 (+) Transcript_35422:56-802(+)
MAAVSGVLPPRASPGSAVAGGSVAAADPGQGQALLAGSILDHAFEGNRFWPWKCSTCGGGFAEHREVAVADVERAVSALAAKAPEPHEVFAEGTWRLWLGNLGASSSKRALDAWTAGTSTGGAVVVAAEGLGDFFPRWASAFAAQSGPGGPIRASITLALVDSESEDRFLGELSRAAEFIDEHRAAGRPVLVHCAQGKHRSVAVVVGYLMLRQSMDLDEAFGHVKERRPIAELTACFRKQLQQLRPLS